jgi:hypothetical protein
MEKQLVMHLHNRITVYLARTPQVYCHYSIRQLVRVRIRIFVSSIYIDGTIQEKEIYQYNETINLNQIHFFLLYKIFHSIRAMTGPASPLHTPISSSSSTSKSIVLLNLPIATKLNRTNFLVDYHSPSPPDPTITYDNTIVLNPAYLT